MTTTTRTRTSIPTQLREAGHDVQGVDSGDGRLFLSIDGGPGMTAGEAADLYLPGGFAGAFGART